MENAEVIIRKVLQFTYDALLVTFCDAWDAWCSVGGTSSLSSGNSFISNYPTVIFCSKFLNLVQFIWVKKKIHKIEYTKLKMRLIKNLKLWSKFKHKEFHVCVGLKIRTSLFWLKFMSLPAWFSMIPCLPVCKQVLTLEGGPGWELSNECNCTTWAAARDNKNK